MTNIIKNINTKKVSKIAIVLFGIALLFVSGFYFNSSIYQNKTSNNKFGKDYDFYLQYNKVNKVGAGYFASKVSRSFEKIKIDVLPNHSDILLGDKNINAGDEVKFTDLAKLIIKPNIDEYDSFKWSALEGSKLVSSIITKFAVGGGGGPATGSVTISVEQRTTNHLPNITGTCTVGGNMIFTIKKGMTGIVSEIINKFCDVSPYFLNPTIALPDGKYRVDVRIDEFVSYPICIDILGTPNDDTITGNIPGYNYDCIYGGDGNDTIYTNGGDDVISGENGNDSLFVGTNSNALGGRVQLIGGKGNDTLTGGTQNTFLGGGVTDYTGNPEQDILVGGAGTDIFYLYGGANIGVDNNFYNDFGDQDYATILNFNPLVDTIINYELKSRYSITYNNGFTSLYLNNNGNLDLIAKIESNNILDLNASYFQ